MLSKILDNQIDVKAGDLTYGQRIELGNYFSALNDKGIETCNEVETIKDVIRILHPKTDVTILDVLQAKKLIGYIDDITSGLMFWLEQEKRLLSEPYDDDEIRAGAKELGAKIGAFGTVKALAKDYSTDPDIILTWSYGKVFGILYTDLEQHRFRKRLSKIRDDKTKQKSKKR